MFGRNKLDKLLKDLDAELRDAPFTEIVIGGGASLMFVWHDRRTKDVDVVSDILPAYLREAIANVGKKHGLDYWWMNDNAAGCLPTGINLNLKRVFSGRKLFVETPDNRALLAMKVAASRDRDKKDAVLLARETGIVSNAELSKLFSKAYPTMKTHGASVTVTATTVVGVVSKPLPPSLSSSPNELAAVNKIAPA